MAIPIRSKHVKRQPTSPTPISSKKPLTKVGFTSGHGSKLAKPETAIYSLAQQFQHFLHLPDPTALYALMGAVAGNMIRANDPLWLMLVGPSGAGKTVLLKSLRKVPGMHLLGDLDTKAAFLSGVKKKEQMAGSKGGLLNTMGSTGAFLWYEFTAILELPRDSLKAILTALRQIYDGHYSRDVGTEGGRTLVWDGHLAAFAGVTNAIDQAHEFASKMGERFIYYRLPVTDGWGESIKILQNDRDKDMAEELAEVVEAFFYGLGLSEWNATQVRDLRQSEINRLIALSQFATQARSGVQRDYQQREIVDVPQAESPMRFTQEFQRLYLGMDLIGVDDEDKWRVLHKVAMDSMPLVRRAAIETMIEKCGGLGGEWGRGATVAELGDYMRVSQTTVRRTLEDLEAHRVVEHAQGENGELMKGWRLTKWAWERVKGEGVKDAEDDDD